MYCEKCGHVCKNGETIEGILYLCISCTKDFSNWCKAMDEIFIGYDFTEYLMETM